MPRGEATPLILASSSPRRRHILGLLNVPFMVRATLVAEEWFEGERPMEAVQRIALAKAHAARDKVTGRAVVVGADTIVLLDGKVLGKPRDAAEAEAMLKRLRGRWHDVLTGVGVVGKLGQTQVAARKTAVLMRRYGDGEIARYVASGEPMDKAGAYAIQSDSFRPVAKIVGCYLNVVGLPLCALASSLCAAGYPLPPASDATLEAECSACEGRDILVTGCT